MVALRRTGATYQRIASAYGVTRERVRQLLASVGEAGRVCADCGARISSPRGRCDSCQAAHEVVHALRVREAVAEYARSRRHRCGRCGRRLYGERRTCAECLRWRRVKDAARREAAAGAVG